MFLRMVPIWRRRRVRTNERVTRSGKAMDGLVLGNGPPCRVAVSRSYAPVNEAPSERHR
jgi:hypothetical protein